MDYIKSSLNWEEYFIQEAIDLEEKMNLLDHQSLGHSRLRLSLNSGILDWKKYQDWVFNHTGTKSIMSYIEDDQLNRIRNEAQNNFSTFSQYSFWNQDLIPIGMWEDSLIVFGLAYDPQLSEIPKTIFILAHPDVLTFVGRSLVAQIETEPQAAASSILLQNEDLLGRVPLEEAPPEASLKTSMTNSEPIWDYISERHEEYSFEVKKQFNAYAVLRIVNQKTQIYKMDAELEKQVENRNIFNFDLKNDNPFHKVFTSGISESFNVTQLGITLFDYKYICITALKRGTTVVGFLLGLKLSQLAEVDQLLLEDLAKESA